jgi:hypothetical protein
MGHHAFVVDLRSPISRGLARAQPYYQGRLQEPLHIPKSWSPEEQRELRVEWWEHGAHRCRKSGEWVTASQCYAKARAACSESRAGRPEWSGQFDSPEEFRQIVVRDLVALMAADPPQKPTMEALATLWSERDPTTYSDSVATRIKRYCKKSGYAWKTLKAEAIQRAQCTPA